MIAKRTDFCGSYLRILFCYFQYKIAIFRKIKFEFFFKNNFCILFLFAKIIGSILFFSVLVSQIG
jgi:hypothetical protein